MRFRLRPIALPAWLRRGPLWRMLSLMLLPLLIAITAAELWLTRQDAVEAANAAYDRSLWGALKSMDANLSTASGGLAAELPYGMFEFFELTANGRVYFRIASSDGLVELGNADLPLPPPPAAAGVAHFYDAQYFGESVRVAALLRPLPAPGAQVWIQVAESTQSRRDFTQRLVRRAAVRDALILGLMVLGAAAVLAVALRPLAQLAQGMQKRDPQDATPVPADALPADVRPLVVAMNQHMQRSQQLVLQQRQFLDDASHQLRTHLTTLQMQVDYALRPSAEQDIPQALQAMGQEVARATHSTQQLLALGRSDTAAIELQPFALDALVRAVALELLPRARLRQLDFGVTVTPENIQAHGDPHLLREALRNLAINAMAYTPQGGTVTLTASEEAGGWSLGVEDNGPGMREDERLQRERGAQRYRRGPAQGESPLPHAHPPVHGGSGLGLAIARTIALRHHGGLRLRAGPGEQGLYASLWWPHAQ